MSVRVGQFAGLDAVQKVANDLGVSQNVPHGPAIYIGSFETDLKDLTAAYSVFPNAGMRKQAYVIERIDDANHKPIYLAAYLYASPRPGRGLDDLAVNGRSFDARDCRQRPVLVRLQIAGSRQNWYDQRLQGCVVSGLYQYSDLRCVGRLRSADNNYFTRLRRRAGVAGLDTGNEQGGATLPSRSVAT